jgi:hypothetical protein
MNRILALLIILAVLLASSACGAKKPPEQAAIKSRNVLSVLREMNSSYEKKNLDAFLTGVAADFPEREAFAKSVAGVFAKYETIQFNIQYTRMLIMIEDKGRIKTTFTWDAQWKTAEGTSVKDGARVTLVFEPAGYKLASIEGKNPFLAQPGETPGNK